MLGSSMQKKVLGLFKDYDPKIQEIIAEVLNIEQEHLSMKNPRGAVERIEDVIDRVAKDEIR